MLFIFYSVRVQPLIVLFEGSLFKIYNLQSKIYQNRLHILLCVPAPIPGLQLDLLVRKGSNPGGNRLPSKVPN